MFSSSIGANMSESIQDCSGHGYWDDNQCRCYAGWIGDHCMSQCPLGYYGIGCVNVCTCGKGTSCDVFTGKCSCESTSGCNQCKDGLYGPTCTIPCLCEGGSCNASTGVCFLVDSSRSTTVSATGIAAITFGIILSIILILILVSLWLLWRRKHYFRTCALCKHDRQKQVADVEDILNDFDIVYEVGSGRNSIDTDVGSIASSNKLYPGRVVQHRELPGIPEEEEEIGGIPENEEENTNDHVQRWGFEKPLNSEISISSTVKGVHGSVRSNVDIHNEPDIKSPSPNPPDDRANLLNIGVDSTKVDLSMRSRLEQALLSEDYMELRRSIENLTAVISTIPQAISRSLGSSSVSLVGRSETSSDHEDCAFRSLPSINVSDNDDMHVSGSDDIESCNQAKRKKKRTHNYLAINTGNAPSSSDEDDINPSTVYDDAIRSALSVDLSGNESDSRGYSKVDRTKRSYSREYVDGNEYGSLQIVRPQISHSQNKVSLANNDDMTSPVSESNDDYLEAKLDKNAQRFVLDNNQELVKQDEQYLEVKSNCNANKPNNSVAVTPGIDTMYLQTIPCQKEPTDSLEQLPKKIEHLEQKTNKVANEYENQLRRQESDEPESIVQQTTQNQTVKISNDNTQENSTIPKLSKLSTLEDPKNYQIQSARSIKSKIPIRVTKQFST